MKADAGENGSLRPATGEPQLESSALTRGVGAACWFLWGVTAVVELSLLTRVIVMLLQGINEDGSGPTHFATVLYSVTDVLPHLFRQVANPSIPINGLPHALDVPSILAMDALFFAVLAVTKLSMWTARWYVARNKGKEPKPVPSAEPAPARPQLVTDRVPVVAERAGK